MVRPKFKKKRVKFVKTPIVWKADVARDELDIKPIAYPPHRRSVTSMPAWATDPPTLGQLFTVTMNLQVRDTQYEKSYYTQFYLRKTFVDFKLPMVTINALTSIWPPQYPIQLGNLAMYAGTFHVSETDTKTGHEIRTLCHSFIINGVRYIMHDLNWVKPI